jgi:4a-hydroxytetrahydrobiopterin dehydratase
MSDTPQTTCAPCRADAPTLGGAELQRRHADLGPGWRLVEEHHLERTYKLRNFRDALAFSQRIGDAAEALGHHPEIHLSWGQVRVAIWTHKAGGLTESDFVLAARIDALPGTPAGAVAADAATVPPAPRS